MALGAVAPGGVVLWDERHAPDQPRWRQERLREQQGELARRQDRFHDPPAASIAGRQLVVVDDGIATGFTAKAALLSLRRLDPASLCLAVPVIDQQVLPDLDPLLDRLETLAVVRQLRAVGLWYERFEQLEDGDVLALLARASQALAARGPGGDGPG